MPVISTLSSCRGCELKNVRGVGWAQVVPGPYEFSVSWEARQQQIDSLIDLFIVSGLPSSKVTTFSNKDSLGDEMLAAALLKAKSQVSSGSLTVFFFPILWTFLV